MEGTAPPQASAVGECYLEMFFSKLFEAPRDVHRFYKNPSQLTAIFAEDPAKELTARGQKQVNDFFLELDFIGWEAPEALRHVSYQDSVNHSVLIHHTSVFRHASTGRSRRVSQTILLAVEPEAANYDHYFVLNDIIVLFPLETAAPAEPQPAADSEPKEHAAAAAQPEPNVEPEPAPEVEVEAQPEPQVEAEPEPVPVPEPVSEPEPEPESAVVAETPAPVIPETPAVVVETPAAIEPQTPAPKQPETPAAPVNPALAGPTPAQAASAARPQEPVQTGPPSFAQLVRKNVPRNFVPVPQPDFVNPPAPLPVAKSTREENGEYRKSQQRSERTERTGDSTKPRYDYSVHIPQIPDAATRDDIHKLIQPNTYGKIEVRKGDSTAYANIFVSTEKLMKSVAEAVQANKGYFQDLELKAIERRPRSAQSSGNGEARPKTRKPQN